MACSWSLVSKKQQSSSLEINIQKNGELEEGEETIQENDPTTITTTTNITNAAAAANNNNNDDVKIATHIYLKPHPDGTPLDREVVLRRIRHRKRVRNINNALQAFLTSPFSSNNKNPDTTPVSAPRVKWADDAFAAP